MKRAIQILLVVGIIGIAVWLWTVMFPSPEKAIRSRLNALAKSISFNSGGGLLANALNSEKAADFFTTDVEVDISVPGYEQLTLRGRDEVLQTAAGARTRLTSLKVEFPDMNIMVDADKQSAKVNLTGKATVPGEKDVTAQEFNFMLKKVDGKWQIYRVETVKTLSLLPRIHRCFPELRTVTKMTP